MHKYSFTIGWSELDQNYVALCPEFPDLSGLGETPEQAIAELRIALELAIETYQAEGWRLPEPKQNQYSGKLLVRMPKSLHGKLAQQAEVEGVSLNTHVVTVLAEGAGSTTVRSEMKQMVADMLRPWKTEMMQTVASVLLLHQYASATRFVQHLERQPYPEETPDASSQVRVLTVQQAISPRSSASVLQLSLTGSHS